MTLLGLVMWGVVIAIMVMSIILHEIAHGLAAYWQGDTTAQRMGRLTLNPIAHIDWFMTIILPILLLVTSGVIFGGAKPVPVNPMNFKDPRKGMMWVALAGPVTNFLIAICLALLLFVTTVIRQQLGVDGALAETALIHGMFFNVLLGVFNLVPIPPLDGSRVVAGLGTPEVAKFMYSLEHIGLFLVFGIFFMVPGVREAVFAVVYFITELLLWPTLQLGANLA